MNVLKLISPIPVSVNHYIKARAFLVKGKPQVLLYETAEAKKYKKEFVSYIKKQVKLQKWNWIPNKTQHFYVDCIFYFERIDKDANNYYKLLLDSITETKLVWLDDNVACERTNGVFYDSKNPRIEITIYPVDYVGIFPTINQLDNFKSNCILCKRYRNGKCSILKKAIEGRIQNEIKNLNCSEYKINDLFLKNTRKDEY